MSARDRSAHLDAPRWAGTDALVWVLTWGEFKLARIVQHYTHTCMVRFEGGRHCEHAMYENLRPVSL